MKRLQQICAIGAGIACLVQGTRFSRLKRDAANSSIVEGWGPNVESWPAGGAPWASIYQKFAPAPVCDFCGGFPGHTKWTDVARPCAEWTIKTIKCYQACFQTNRLSGFGNCMNGCSGPPQANFCVGTGIKKDIKKVCSEFNYRWKLCRVSEHMWETPEQWFEAIDKCVFVCKTSLETQRSLGLQFGLSWRKTKCQPEIFYCDFETEECVHAKAQGDLDPQNAHCAPPVGSSGAHKCFFDDPGCGSGCKRPQPATLPIPFPAPAPAPAIAPAIDFLARSRKPQI
eukprot:gnl/TRDRNA2_/TRDRNA2_84594_c0_seq2.p1 gnl/TRDRNA2_/TRDRNA2_84594_c0~~gnl/TRDRNA2_/TRDRNA2_84594_c0_seq2.p1  ORF type:complete len:284 (+),score=27.30 gnl/TRDRNA2_/TRDRNA2_84594_c0_seq2:138-989(+)